MFSAAQYLIWLIPGLPVVLVVPGLVYLTAARLRDREQPYHPLTLRSLWLLVGFYALALLVLTLVDWQVGERPIGRWLAGFLTFTGSSWGSLAVPLIYERRHAG